MSRLPKTDLNDPNFKFSVARARVQQKAPYFGVVLYSLCPIEVDKIRRAVRTKHGWGIQEMDTFAVTSKGLMLYTRAALDRFTEDNLTFVLCHEVMHVMLQHGIRCAAGGYDPILWNIACDVFINDQLREGGWAGWPPTSCWPETWELPQGLTADEYYHLLNDIRAKQQEKKDEREEESACLQCGSRDHAHDGDTDGEGEDDDGGGCPSNKPGMIDGQPDLTEMAGNPEETFGQCGSAAGNQVENEGDLHAEALEAERSEAEMDTIRQAAARELVDHAKKHPGTVPGGLARWVGEILGPPKVRWQDSLSRTLRRSANMVVGRDDYAYGRMHTRQAGFGWGPRSIVLPTMVSPVPEILVAVDTSGSMGQEHLQIGLRELAGILKLIRAKITICSCDAAVHEMKKVGNWREAAAALVGGGGTSFIPIFDAIEKLPRRPDIVVVVTDGWGSAPETAPVGYTTIWLEVGEGSTSPCSWGKHIQLKD